MQITPGVIAAECESIGRNCEFGLVQRKYGIEPAHLLRWAGSTLPGLAAAFEHGFDGLAEEMTGHPEETPEGHPHRRWLLTCQRYGITFHVEAPLDACGPEQAGAASVKRLRWLARQLLQGIAERERILVYSSRYVGCAEDCAALVNAIRGHGDTPVLLVGQAQEIPVAATRWPGVWFATLPSLTRMDWAGGVDLDAWDRVMTGFVAAIGRIGHAVINPRFTSAA